MQLIVSKTDEPWTLHTELAVVELLLLKFEALDAEVGELLETVVLVVSVLLAVGSDLTLGETLKVPEAIIIVFSEGPSLSTVVVGVGVAAGVTQKPVPSQVNPSAHFAEFEVEAPQG